MKRKKIVCSILTVCFLSSLFFQNVTVLANENTAENVISVTQEQNNENYIFYQI